jgi:hypothetical protein
MNLVMAYISAPQRLHGGIDATHADTQSVAGLVARRFPIINPLRPEIRQNNI